LLLIAFLLVNAPNCHLSLVLASVVQGDAVNCNIRQWTFSGYRSASGSSMALGPLVDLQWL